MPVCFSLCAFLCCSDLLVCQSGQLMEASYSGGDGACDEMRVERRCCQALLQSILSLRLLHPELGVVCRAVLCNFPYADSTTTSIAQVWAQLEAEWSMHGCAGVWQQSR